MISKPCSQLGVAMMHPLMTTATATEHAWPWLQLLQLQPRLLSKLQCKPFDLQLTIKKTQPQLQETGPQVTSKITAASPACLVVWQGTSINLTRREATCITPNPDKHQSMRQRVQPEGKAQMQHNLLPIQNNGLVHSLEFLQYGWLEKEMIKNPLGHLAGWSILKISVIPLFPETPKHFRRKHPM